MVAFITGGSGSGKSVYGEDLASTLNKSELIYIATMKPYGSEGAERVEKHTLQRQGKGFVTYEIYENLDTLQLAGNPTVLLECMSNLLANEMFHENNSWEKISLEETVEKIVRGVSHLINICDNVIIISNEIFSEGDSQYESTKLYTQCLGRINQRLGALSNVVCEVIYGYPYFFKNQIGVEQL